MNKKLFTFSNILTAAFIIFILVMLFNPAAKAKVIQGLMKIGLFQPDLPENYEVKKADNTTILSPRKIVFKDSEGQFLDLSEQKGKVIFVNFWATWCPPCIAEMPSIYKLYKEFENNETVLFVMVDADNNLKKSNAFQKKHGYTFPLYNLAGSIPEDYYSGTLPTTLIIDKEGNIAYKHSGAADYSHKEVADFINSLIKK
ncbi:MAG: TlpA disulfide reductase family protein [Ginsengibacter sp.]